MRAGFLSILLLLVVSHTEAQEPVLPTSELLPIVESYEDPTGPVEPSSTVLPVWFLVPCALVESTERYEVDFDIHLGLSARGYSHLQNEDYEILGLSLLEDNSGFYDISRSIIAAPAFWSSGATVEALLPFSNFEYADYLLKLEVLVNEASYAYCAKVRYQRPGDSTFIGNAASADSSPIENHSFDSNSDAEFSAGGGCSLSRNSDSSPWSLLVLGLTILAIFYYSSSSRLKRGKS